MTFPETKKLEDKLESKLDEIKGEIRQLAFVLLMGLSFLYISNLAASFSRSDIKKDIKNLSNQIESKNK